MTFCILIEDLICYNHTVMWTDERICCHCLILLLPQLYFGYRDKKKDFAPNCAAFYPFGVDVFLCPRKIDHIARFVELPSQHISGDVPSILVVNVQVHIAG